MGRVRLMLKRAHEIVENDPIFRVSRSGRHNQNRPKSKSGYDGPEAVAIDRMSRVDRQRLDRELHAPLRQVRPAAASALPSR
jgi:hypothetical protein